MKVLILNGPNLQLLGRRKVEVYGVVPLPEIESRLRVVAAELGVELGFMQSNHEGVIVDAIAQALADGVEFAELAAPVKQADGVLQCEKMVLGEADASGRRSPVGSGAFFDIPCDLVISAVGEQVDDALMAANGIELDKKGRPAFQTNVEGVYAAGDAKRGPATVVEGIADAAAFAEAVIGKAHTYDIPEQAYVTKADAEAKKGILAMSGCICREGERCLQCATVCENCVDSCPNRANVTIRMADGSHQIVHVDKMCNECGNCTQFCPYASEPCHDKFTLFQTAEDMVDSKNAGVLFLGGDMVRVRTFGEPKDYDLSKSNDLPADNKLLCKGRNRKHRRKQQRPQAGHYRLFHKNFPPG